MHRQLHNKSRCQSMPPRTAGHTWQLHDWKESTCTHEASGTLVPWGKNRRKQEARERSRHKGISASQGLNTEERMYPLAGNR